MDRRTLSPPLRPFAPFPAPHEQPDAAVVAGPLLARLRDALRAAVKTPQARRWGVPKLFFFDRALQAELDAARPDGDRVKLPNDLVDLIDDARTVLTVDRHARRAARAVRGLREAAEALAAAAKPVRELADLLAVADDEVVRVICPAERAGFRLMIRGVGDVRQLHVLLANHVTGDPRRGRLAGARPHPRAVAAAVGLLADDGVEFTPRFQMFRPAALRPDGTLPAGLAGSDHWLWGPEWVSGLPLVDGERAVLLGGPAVVRTWAVEPRVPRVGTEVTLLETMSAADVAGWIAGRTGRRPDWTAETVRRAA